MEKNVHFSMVPPIPKVSCLSFVADGSPAYQSAANDLQISSDVQPERVEPPQGAYPSCKFSKLSPKDPKLL